MASTIRQSRRGLSHVRIDIFEAIRRKVTIAPIFTKIAMLRPCKQRTNQQQGLHDFALYAPATTYAPLGGIGLARVRMAWPTVQGVNSHLP